MFFLLQTVVISLFWFLRRHSFSGNQIDEGVRIIKREYHFFFRWSHDLSQSFKTESDDPTIQNLHRELNEAIAKLRMSRKEKDSEYQFFKNIVQHVAIGLLTFKRDGSLIQIMNTAAKRLLRITKADHIDDLKEVSETLVDTFLKLKTGGRELLQLKFGDETIQLSVFAIELTLRDEEVKLISMNIFIVN